MTSRYRLPLRSPATGRAHRSLLAPTEPSEERDTSFSFTFDSSVLIDSTMGNYSGIALCHCPLTARKMPIVGTRTVELHPDVRVLVVGAIVQEASVAGSWDQYLVYIGDSSVPYNSRHQTAYTHFHLVAIQRPLLYRTTDTSHPSLALLAIPLPAADKGCPCRLLMSTAIRRARSGYPHPSHRSGIFSESSRDMASATVFWVPGRY
jgi:hypothetical protein